MIPCISLSFRQVGQRVWHHLLTTDAFSYTQPHRVLRAYTHNDQPQHGQQRVQVNSLIVLQARERFSVVLTVPADANPEKHRISVLSPLGAALIGLQCGDLCTVNVAGIQTTFTVIQVIN